MTRYLCIHGHYYQPPRENPWLDSVERQESAAPYHDWNERITAECYGPNAAARILDDDGTVRRVLSNYSRTSFDFGPTLLRWLETESPDVYHAILEADRESRTLFAGHGGAMAQAYNHMIMPLANRRDRATQVVWGLRDFEHRFGRRAEGMWLPETAVDLSSLEQLAAEGVLFTVLEPGQARRVRTSGTRAWRELQGGEIDPTLAYRQRLPSGRSIDLFFYDGPTSRAIAFDGLLDRGDAFAARLLPSPPSPARKPQLVHVATDGESYGHHHRFGEMALAWVLDHVERGKAARLTNYGEFLERHPPVDEVEIRENTSWSCIHGVERWRDDCGCRGGSREGWTQNWRKPLREALDGLREDLVPRYEAAGGRLLRDPWAARDDYIDVLLDDRPAARGRFLARHALQPIDAGRRTAIWTLLEMQRHAMLMYTSCGWFFDDLARIETIQIIRYAARAIELARRITGDDLEPAFLDRLERARSNRPERGNGRELYRATVDAGRAAAGHS